MHDPQKELETFAYIVSHDLNAPFRHIREFGKLLVNKLDDKVSDEERTYLQYMEKSIYKAEAMLDALLKYSRLNTQAEEYSLFNCDEMVQSILSEFPTKIEQTQANISISGLPNELEADQQQIRLLFSCLLDNVFQYARPDIPLRLDIAAEPQGDHWLFSIKDNGSGITKNQLDNVFTMFRGTSGDESSGIGAGLALAQKVVQRHNGKIWIESEPNTGTQVFFTI